MSATGRGTERNERDLYETPAWLTRAILSHLPANPKQILEPACGNGAIVGELRTRYRTANIISMDLQPGNAMSDAITADFLTLPPTPSFDLIITNPPYSLAREFCERAALWRYDEKSLIVMLLRINFLAGQKRAAWMRANTPSIYVSPKRPSFTGGGTDATDYAFFVWGLGTPKVHILKTENDE